VEARLSLSFLVVPSVVGISAGVYSGVFTRRLTCGVLEEIFLHPKIILRLFKRILENASRIVRHQRGSDRTQERSTKKRTFAELSLCFLSGPGVAVVKM